MTITNIKRARTPQRAFSGAILFWAVVSLPAFGQSTTPPAGPTRTVAQRALDAANAKNALLDKTLALHLEQVTLEQALSVLSEKAGIQLVYSREHVPVNKIVSLVADKITVRDALNVLLQDTGLEPDVGPEGLVRLRPAGGSVTRFADQQQGTATISGFTRDSATGASIPQVTIRVDGTVLETKSGADGRYSITGIAAGEYRVTARRVGYIAQTRMVTLSDGQASTLNFGLNPPVTRLDEIVTTAIGQQRRYQIGNVISTINVDSLSPTAPVASVTDILSGRAPGVEVVEGSGLVGSGEAIRIRGQSSMALQSDPIIIIDGVREDNSPGGFGYALGYTPGPSPNRLNDLDFSQIATIDILKGPAATTEYGTEAANGVIVITTKRGASGATQWHASAEQAASVVPIGFPENYTSWGHATNGTDVPVACPLNESREVFVQTTSLAGTCAVDSVTHFNPLNHPAYSIFGTGPSSKYDLDVSGGSESLRYYIAGNLGTAVGLTHLPSVFRGEALALGFPESYFSPNSQNQRSLRTNMDVRLGSTADIQVNVAYLSTYQATPASGLLQGPLSGISYPDSAYDYGYGHQMLNFFTRTYTVTNQYDPLSQLGNDANQQTNRFTGGLTLNWRPRGWLTGRATFGIDHGSQQANALSLPESQSYEGHGAGQGSITEGYGTNDTYTIDLGATATASLTSSIRSATSIGLQLVDNETNGVTAFSGSLSAADFTFNGNGSGGAIASDNYATTLGGYVSEVISLHDRLFITGSLRSDAGSNFGGHYDAIVYPGTQVSWLAINTPAVTLRLRGALGESGQQPAYGAALQQYSLTTVQGPGNNPNPITGYVLSSGGNLKLTPERSVEYEGGEDLSLFANRLTLDVTGYSKTTFDALYNETLGFDLADLSYQENLGEVRNTGVEASLVAVLVQSPLWHWTVTVNASVNNNKLVKLAPGVVTVDAGAQYGGDASQMFAAGYPLYGYWGNRIAYTDANHDGIIEADEITGDTALSYLGSSLPTQETSLQTSIGVWRDVLTVGALFDYRSGFRVLNQVALQSYRGFAGTSNFFAQNVPNAPLWQQAQLQSANVPAITGYPSEYFESGSYLRFRELSLTYNLPRRWARAIRVTRFGLTGAVRNLALWTRYSGGDPEVSDNSSADNNQSQNNDLRANGFGAIPLTRSWMVRLNLGL